MKAKAVGESTPQAVPAARMKSLIRAGNDLPFLFGSVRRSQRYHSSADWLGFRRNGWVTCKASSDCPDVPPRTRISHGKARALRLQLSAVSRDGHRETEPLGTGVPPCPAHPAGWTGYRALHRSGSSSAKPSWV